MNRRAKLQEDTKYRVLQLLQRNPDLTQRELAHELGMSVGGINYCLKALIQKGLVKMNSFAHSKNKFGYIYVLTPSGLVEKAKITQQFLERKITEYELLQKEIITLAAELGKSEF